jgi:hypothetical protein
VYSNAPFSAKPLILLGVPRVYTSKRQQFVSRILYGVRSEPRAGHYTVAENCLSNGSNTSRGRAQGNDSQMTQLTQPGLAKAPRKRDIKGTKETSASKPASARNVPKARKATASQQGAAKGQKGQSSPSGKRKTT